MMENPFVVTTPLNLPLQLDLCQQIDYAALRLAARTTPPIDIPDGVHLDQFRQVARLHGPSTYLRHPSDIERIFSGITMTVYQTIARLYCDRLGRSVETVGRILDAMARHAEKPSIAYEAVWAICLYLDERRQASTDVTVEQTSATWQVVQITLDINIRGMPKPSIVCVLDTTPPRVLAFRLSRTEAVGENIALAIYDAIVSQRRPARDGAAGLIWQFPARIETELNLSQDYREACSRLGIFIEQAKSKSDLVNALHGEWTRDLVGRTLTHSRFVNVLDNYLQHIHGYSPIRKQEALAYDFTHLVGFNRDPAWQFPALRDFLPSHPGVVQKDGTVEYDGLHYEEPLLAYWPGREIALRRSEMAEAVAWIYLDGEIFCQAAARELRRQDGSYRPWR